MGFIPIPFHLQQGEKKIDKNTFFKWREYARSAPADDVLEKAFNDPFYNGIGIKLTGVAGNLVVVDVDVNENGEINTPMWLYSAATLICKSINGGYHFYFKYPKNKSYAHGTFSFDVNGQKIEVHIDDRLMVVPPTMFGEQQYQWIEKPPGFEPGKPFDKEFFLSDLPDEVLAKWDEINSPQQRTGLDSILPPERVGDTPLAKKATKGNRYELSAQVAGFLIGSMSPQLWDTAGYQMFCKWCDENCEPSLLKEDPKEVNRTWNRIMKLHVQQYGHTTKYAYYAEVPGEENNNQPQQEYYLYIGSEIGKHYDALLEEHGHGLSTGYDMLDDYIRPKSGEMCVIAAETSVGKTTFSVNVGRRMALAGHRVLFASLEQGTSITDTLRALDPYSQVIPENFMALVAENTSIDTFRSAIAKLTEQNKRPEILMIDHIHYMARTTKDGSLTGSINDLTYNLQNLAHELKIPIWVVAHLRKINGNRPPELDDLKDASALSQAPAIVLMLHRPKLGLEDVQKYNAMRSDNGLLLIRKNRMGRTGAIPFRFSGDKKLIFELANPTKADVLDLATEEELEDAAKEAREQNGF